MTVKRALAAGLTVAAAIAVLLLAGGGGYTLSAEFPDAGQLVPGGEVQVAGRRVGTITALALTDSGQAKVTMTLSDPQLTPLHAGTRAIIRAVGQAGVDNRFIQLIPGTSTARVLHSGSTLPASQTTGIVDLDAVLDEFTPPVRRSLAQLFAHGAQAFAGSGSRWFNRMLTGLDPALQSLASLGGQLATDQAELVGLVGDGATAAGAISSRSQALSGVIAGAARTFTELAVSRTQLRDLLARAPGLLEQAGGTLARTGRAVLALRPALRAATTVGPSLGRLVGLVSPTLGSLTPAVAGLDTELTPLRRTLRGVGPLADPATTALDSTKGAFKSLLPILTGLREYGSDIVLGIFNGLGGLVSGPYDAVGHYAKLNFVQSPQTVLSGNLSSLLSTGALAPGLLSVRTHLVARCPGGDAPPAPDGSNPWIPSKYLCNPADDMPLSVDFP